MIDINDINAFLEDGTFHAYDRAARASSDYPNRGSIKGLQFATLGLAAEAGELAGHLAKSVWHEDSLTTGAISEETRRLMLKEVGDILWYCSAVCHELNSTTENEALNNLHKLHDRAQRNVLRGNGDDR